MAGGESNECERETGYVEDAAGFRDGVLRLGINIFCDPRRSAGSSSILARWNSFSDCRRDSVRVDGGMQNHLAIPARVDIWSPARGVDFCFGLRPGLLGGTAGAVRPYRSDDGNDSRLHGVDGNPLPADTTAHAAFEPGSGDWNRRRSRAGQPVCGVW